MHAPMMFFETTPTGRILNRFSSDLDMIDAKIPQQLKNFLSCLTMILGTFVVITGVTPYFLVPVLPIGVCYVFLQVCTVLYCTVLYCTTTASCRSTSPAPGGR